MKPENNEPRRVGDGGGRGNSSRGGAEPIVEQTRRRRDAASRCNPLDCGHRDPLDCTAAGCGEPVETAPAPSTEPDVDTDALTELWANAKAAWCRRDFPKYGSREWIALTPDDPRRLAGALEAAEMWRRYGDEEELLKWFKNLSRSPEAVLRARSIAELDRLAKPHPPHVLRATPGWPPIRIPGGNGRYLTYTERRAAA
ncbi:hypothetical protein STXM2123_1777 [Streptomyces sp. F-3]|uniref:hypothetical protein n=1 Tax=Streptomyces sp. F-3 TaxID=1840095 RepID=UPI0007C32DD0|nr:hypothetical protein [Streptomyces sp. F-3]GAT81076.1 hypothetical protein STXM2123_1777 [Streptomyces sp. F-3]